MELKVLAAIAAMVVSLTGCGSGTQETARPVITPVPFEINPDSYSAGSGNDVYTAYEELSGSEKNLYDEMCAMIENYETELVIHDRSREEITEAYKAVIGDHPEYFWINGGYSYQETTGAEGTVTVLKPALSPDFDEVRERSAELEKIVNEIVSEAQTMKSSYEKILYIHDYIVDNTRYDTDTYRSINSLSGGGIFRDASTAYGALVGKTAVCSGYSAAFQLLAQRLGFQCGRISGTAGGGNHEWNYIMLDGEYYYMDVTWDDPQYSGEKSDVYDNKSYDFFCITTEELEKTHTIGGEQFVPECTASYYDYYVYNGLYMDTYDFIHAAAIITGRNSDTVRMKFNNEEEAQKAVNDLIKGDMIFEVIPEASVSYSVGNSGNTLIIKI